MITACTLVFEARAQGRPAGPGAHITGPRKGTNSRRLEIEGLAALMQKMETFSLRQLWHLINTLIKVRNRFCQKFNER